MTKKTVQVTLNEGKILNIDDVLTVSQGENKTTVLILRVPTAMSTGTDYYLEFLCPKNKRYISPLLEKGATVGGYVLHGCEIPSCVLQEPGFVQVQAVARSQEDNTVVFKSKLTNQSSFFVNQSINATQLYQAEDYFAKVEASVASARALASELQEAQQALQTALEGLDQRIETKAVEVVTERSGELAASFNQEVEDLRYTDDVLMNQIGDNYTIMEEHVYARNNPHYVTKAQVGLGDVDNVRQYSASNPNFTDDLPKANGTASAGTSIRYSRSDHVHPSDSTKANLNEVLRFVPQQLSSAQKAQARANINAGCSNFSGDYYDLDSLPDLEPDSETRSYWAGTSELLLEEKGVYLVDGKMQPRPSSIELEFLWYNSHGGFYETMRIPSDCTRFLFIIYNLKTTLLIRAYYVMEDLTKQSDYLVCEVEPNTPELHLEFCGSTPPVGNMQITRIPAAYMD